MYITHTDNCNRYRTPLIPFTDEVTVWRLHIEKLLIPSNLNNPLPKTTVMTTKVVLKFLWVPPSGLFRQCKIGWSHTSTGVCQGFTLFIVLVTMFMQ